MEQDNHTNNINSTNSIATTNSASDNHIAAEDDVWGEEEFQVDGQNNTKIYDQYVATLNYDRMRETFVTLGIKDGVSEGLDEARQVYFEKGLVGGIREGIVSGFLIQLLSLNGLIDEEKKAKMKSESALWKKEKMKQVMEMIMEKKEQDGDDEDLKLFRQVIEKHADQVEMFKTTYESILRY